MKATLIRLSVFLLLFTTLSAAGLLMQWGYFRLNPYPIKDAVQTLITGNSIIKLSIDPSQINNSISVAQSAESYQTSYYKLKHLLNLHKSIHNVVLGISPENFVAHGLPLSTHDTYPAGHANIGIYNLVTINDLVQDEDLHVETFIKGYLKTALYNFNFYRALATEGDYYPFIGGFQANAGRRPNLDISYPVVFDNIYGTDHKKINTVLPQAGRYLQKIIDLCEERGIKLHLIYVPAHPEHHQRIPELFKAYYAEFVDRIKHNTALRYYDFGHERLPDGYFYDPFHLNAKGAKFFSQNIGKLLAENGATQHTDSPKLR